VLGGDHVDVLQHGDDDEPGDRRPGGADVVAQRQRRRRARRRRAELAAQPQPAPEADRDERDRGAEEGAGDVEARGGERGARGEPDDLLGDAASDP
jgi:hypothetical protein